MAYRVTGLDPAQFKHLFALSDEALAEAAMRRTTVTQALGFPCRVSLVDRPVGEQVILLNHVSHDVANPYRSSHAIFVADAPRGKFVDEPPPVFATRLLSLRGFDEEGMMADALLALPGEADGAIRTLFDSLRSPTFTPTTPPAAAFRRGLRDADDR